MIATYVVDMKGELWIADRRSEHIACARGSDVLAAGEMQFEVNATSVRATTVSNLSTGYCPAPRCFASVAHALDAAGIAHPGHLTARFTFRKCQDCGWINVIKDDWFVCSVCESDLPLEV
ncbi:MAG: hypothetical protein EXR79_08780 [Myxococcales bacterium]|nr:hypothetical protein [Myxococcales bacterium]